MPSIISFLSILLILFMGILHMYQTQMKQLKLTEQFYETRAMIGIAEKNFEQTFQKNPSIRKATINFQKGDVVVRMENKQLFFSANHIAGFQLQEKRNFYLQTL